MENRADQPMPPKWLNTTNPDRLIPCLWAHLILARSGWSATKVDREFFNGTSAFHRYLKAKSPVEGRRAQPLADNPFLQIDSCWPGTIRWLAHPYRHVFTLDPSLRDLHRAMFCIHPKFRDLLFAGGRGYRRTYRSPVVELDALRSVWKDLRAHAQWYFLDMLCALACWIREAALIADQARLELISPATLLPTMEFSFTSLDFLDRGISEFMDRWLQIKFIEPVIAEGAYRWSPAIARWDFITSCDLFQRDCARSLHDFAALNIALFEGRLLELGEMPGIDPMLASSAAMSTEPSWSVRKRFLSKPSAV